ncbi:dephospho-CoA kinase [Arthrobacter sp.]|uniref:dephospho-CoA kinase n=1 Tax=Arthrobacter sp. TaxID=1667 RepID=UPI003A8EFBF6
MVDGGLTGGIAAGKSAVAARLVELGAGLGDAEAIAPRGVGPGTVGLGQDGEVRPHCSTRGDAWTVRGRPAAFADAKSGSAQRHRPPAVRAEAAGSEKAAGETAGHPVIVVRTSPAGGDRPVRPFDLVVTVQAPAGTDLRMVADRGMTEQEAAARIPPRPPMPSVPRSATSC